jgi:DNA (cytosine-5)-methyltransferase 1
MTDDRLVLDLFAGPGGWDQGLRDSGFAGRIVGVEWNAAACATARAAGHERVWADVAETDPTQFGRVWGLLASPPCQGFSVAGSGAGRRDSELLLEAISLCRTLGDVAQVRREIAPALSDPRSVLVLEPLRYLVTANPAWSAWEQVETVQPLWDAYAAVLESLGYTVATGVVAAEQYGLPQTRRRAILLAHSPDIKPAALPEPTHSKYHVRSPERLDSGVSSWVSMAEALGWGPETALVQRSNYNGGNVSLSGTRQRATRPLTAPSSTITSKLFHWMRPDGSFYRATLPEAGLLQGFPSDYPWRGGITQMRQQIGDAVPPTLAAAVCRAALSS